MLFLCTYILEDHVSYFGTIKHIYAKESLNDYAIFENKAATKHNEKAIWNTGCA